MQLPSAVASIVFQEFEDGAVLFAPEHEYYFGLNDVGMLIWGLLPPRCRSLDELCVAIAAQYPDVTPEVIRADAVELLDRLVEEGLATTSTGEAGDAPAAS